MEVVGPLDRFRKVLGVHAILEQLWRARTDERKPQGRA